MDVAAAIKISLVFLLFGFVTSLVCTYFMVGCLSGKGNAILGGVFLLLLVAYIIFYIVKSDRQILRLAILGTTAALVLASSITLFIRSTKQVTLNSKAGIFFIALFIALGLYESVAFVWPQLLLKLFSTIVQPFDTDFLYIVSFSLNVLFSLICALFVIVPTVYEENIFVEKQAVLGIATVAINSVISFIAGFSLQFKAESGYTSQI